MNAVMPSSPRTPTRRRKSSTTSISLSLTSPSSYTNGHCSSKRVSFSRRSSQHSTTSPVMARPISYDRCDEYGSSIRIGDGEDLETSNGLGNLADELAEAFEDDEEGDLEEDSLITAHNGSEISLDWNNNLDGPEITPEDPKSFHKSFVSSQKNLKPAKRHHRRKSASGGSDQDDDSDLEARDGPSPALEHRMATIENLARQGTESTDSEHDDIVYRLIEQLKDLGSQSNIENGSARLVRTHTALTSHIANQNRAITALAHPLVSPFSAAPAPGLIDELLPLLASAILDLPKPISQPISSLHGLHAATAELISMLTSLSDTLHMTRQTSALASRRLRSATDMVLEMRKEADARDEAVCWLEKRNWEKRLAERECARVCGEVIAGFEETCDRWRQNLLYGIEIEGAC